MLDSQYTLYIYFHIHGKFELKSQRPCYANQFINDNLQALFTFEPKHCGLRGIIIDTVCMDKITIQTQSMTFKDKTKVPCQGAQKGVFGQHSMYWYVLPLAPHPPHTASMSACLPVGQVFVVVKQLNFHNLIFINRSCHRPLEGLGKKTQQN